MSSGESVQPKQLSVLFEQALARPPHERASWLAQVCGMDTALRKELTSLLDAYDASTGYFETLSEQVVAPAFAAVVGNIADDIETTVGRYRIVERIGGGGMGVIYKALDPTLDRLVALKFLPPHLGMDTAAKRRFLSEARAASALDHPAVAVVHEIGETKAGQLYIAMTYYDGETLAARIARGPLPVPDALAIARQIADGLAAAHVQGIVHRDIKPSNILIAKDGVVKIVDFGIAKMSGADLTNTSTTVGTIAYMSPEQTRGEVVDARTDLWSLGAVLYEMLTGVRPFRADNEQALIYAIRHDDVAPPNRARRDVTVALARVIQRLLSKDRADRPADAGALVADLRAIEGGGRASVSRIVRRYGRSAALLILALVGALAYWPRPGADLTARAAASAPRVSARLAVLPLINHSPAPEDAYFADGLTEELISRLSKLSGLRVIARASVMRYRNVEKDAGTIARELAVEWLLEGSVRTAENQLRITTRLVDARSQQQVWSAEYDADVSNLLAVQREIAERVAAELNVQLEAEEQRRLARPETDDPDAYRLYLQGRHSLARSDRAAHEKARDYFQQAIDRDPTFARAWSGLSDAYSQLSSVASVLPPEEAYPRARRAAERALELDSDLAEAHASLAATFSLYYWDAETAERHFQRAIALDPSLASAHQWYAMHLRNQGRFDEALAEAKAAQLLDPLSGGAHVEEGIVLYAARRYDDAAAHYERLVRASPAFKHINLFIALVSAQQGRYQTGLDALQRIDPEGMHPDALAMRGYIFARSGRAADARRMITLLNELAAQRPVSGFHLAAIHVALGEHARALDLLEQAEQERTWQMRLLKFEPMFDPLRSEPRFQELLARIGLE